MDPSNQAIGVACQESCAVSEHRPSWKRAAVHGAPAVLAALIPKCPLCWVAYASAFGVAGLAPTAFQWAPTVVFGLLALSVATLVLKRQGRPSLLLVALGASVVIVGLKSAWALLGAPLLVAAAMWPRPAAALESSSS